LALGQIIVGNKKRGRTLSGVSWLSVKKGVGMQCNGMETPFSSSRYFRQFLVLFSVKKDKKVKADFYYQFIN